MASDPRHKNAIITARIRNNDVTGSSIELVVNDGYKKAKYVFDKGLFLSNKEEDNNFTDERYDDVDAVFLTHAHIDHCGQIPHMIKNGFKGNIYMSKQTALISQALIQDEFFVMKQNGIKITKDDERAYRSMINQTRIVDLNENIVLYNARFNMLDNSHVLGSNMIYMSTKSAKTNMHVLVTGDYRVSHPFIKKNGVSKFLKKNPVDVMFIESTYGGKESHPEFIEAVIKLQEAIKETINKKGSALIPVFAFDRAQVILYALSQIQRYDPEFRKIPIYVDGKLLQYINHIYCQNSDIFSTQQGMIMPMNMFNVVGSSQRTRVYKDRTPKIVLASSGQMHAGSIVPYITKMIENPNDSIISVGYVGHKIGRNILDLPEDSEINYAGRLLKIKCKRYQINGFSAHGDMNQLGSLVAKVKRNNPNLKVILYHGTAEGKSSFKHFLCENGIIDAEDIYIPTSDDYISIDKWSISANKLIKQNEDND